jgi:hypothetical protein
MNPLEYIKMPFSFRAGWPGVYAERPSILNTFFFLVLPLSAIPPTMLLYASMHHPEQYLFDTAAARWQIVALAFFVAELLTVPLMGWAIRQVATARDIAADFRDTFLLAAITSVPMCLSGFGLVIPHLWPMITIVVLGFVVAASLLYHGIFYILALDDPMQAQMLGSEVFAMGGIVWTLLCGFVLLTLMH